MNIEALIDWDRSRGIFEDRWLEPGAWLAFKREVLKDNSSISLSLWNPDLFASMADNTILVDAGNTDKPVIKNTNLGEVQTFRIKTTGLPSEGIFIGSKRYHMLFDQSDENRARAIGLRIHDISLTKRRTKKGSVSGRPKAPSKTA